MKIETVEEPNSFSAAIHAMRHPFESYHLSDSKWTDNKFIIGEKDKNLSIRLQKAGPEHCKHLRMIYVWAEITAMRAFWQEFDTYRFGIDKISCSTMHKLMARPLTSDDFEHDSINDEYLKYVIDSINTSMDVWRAEKDETKKKEIWRSIIQALPQSYLQKRTVCMSYAALRNIVRQRAGHKLIEWHQFIDWVKTLPNAWMIFDE